MSPGVQDGQKTQLTPEFPLRVGREPLQDPGHNAEEFAQKPGGVGANERVELMGQREDHMEVGHRQEFGLPVFYPLLLPERLTGGAMPIPAGVVDGNLATAMFATVQMSAQGSRTAVPQMPHDLAGMGFHGMPPDILRPVGSQHVRHPKVRTAHLTRLKQDVGGRPHFKQMFGGQMAVLRRGGQGGMAQASLDYQ